MNKAKSISASGKTSLPYLTSVEERMRGSEKSAFRYGPKLLPAI